MKYEDLIPVIDLAVLRRPLRDDGADAERRSRELERLVEACTTCGVFYLVNDGVPPGLLQRAVAQFDDFFDLSLEERMEIAGRPGETCGYEPLSPEVRELNDSFHCVFGNDEFPHLDLPNPGRNQWPRRLPAFEDTVRETMAALHQLGIDVMSSLAQSLRLPADHFDSVIGPRHAGSLRARRYPPSRDHGGRVGTAAHVDGLPLAFIVQNEVAGLETEFPNVGWIPIAPRPGMIVCQLGSLWARWTNDRYVPNRHRVVNGDASRERRSLIYWFPIHPEALIECLPTCCGPGEPVRYPPIAYSQYIVDWVRGFAEEAGTPS